MAEGLAGLVRQASLVGMFKGFKVATDVEYSLLQFADDTILFGEGCSTFFLQVAAVFLGCKVDHFPLKFLGFMVGGNQRFIIFWKPVITSLKAKLPAWKVSSKVVKDIRAMQRKFLWEGVVDKVGVTWVRWDIVCRSRKHGGLGVKDIGKFNKALLSKWIWIFLVEEEAIWYGVIKERYGDLKSRLWNCEDGFYDSKDSFWSRNLMELCTNHQGILYNMTVKVGNENVTQFWNSRWLGTCSPSCRGVRFGGVCRIGRAESMLIDIQLNVNSGDVIIWPFDVSKCFTDRLPARKQLMCRGIIMQNHEALCVFCQLHIEEPNHLFIHCPKLHRLWVRLLHWLDLDDQLAVDCCSQLLMGVHSLSVFDSEEIFHLILWHTWWWLAIVAKDRITCTFYEWFKNSFLV
ncbi:uncharacterized protein LOC131649670 [Vicia villosa]|uniref:uncharacterized protein LOC131649670 n=1 Tax=Vicia villosa TaxID=3911 RepID=UPI00273AA2F4|nr:uncharacterized protein LOC131649670 [Vicia villosa]